MLIAALGATVVGFVLLIAALITANMWLAVACVAVCAVGVLLLLGDVLTYRRAERDGAPDAGDAERPARGKQRTVADLAAGAGAATAVGAATTGAAKRAGHRAPDTDSEPEPVETGTAESADPADSGVDRTVDGVAGTIGHEEFGHHEGDAPPTQQLALGLRHSAPVDWTHESPADTDDAAERAAFRHAGYDPDKTDLIARIEDGPSWHDSAADDDANDGGDEAEPEAARSGESAQPIGNDDRTRQFPRPNFD
ncbi:hypothetical protein [Tsukamurella soli]|uniref:Uncharacterized protein n=1 Tax=Tsukamurella soli TaxID=644556 RepID=A0ABP8K218_9ACTN